MAANLRAVGANERPARKKHTVETAASQGDQLDLLIAMRDRIAKAITDDKCPPRDLASLTKRLADIAEAIVVLEAAAEDEDEDAADDEQFDASAI